MLLDFFAGGFESRRPAGCIQFSKNEILRLRSGFRLRVPARLSASLTPVKRLNARLLGAGEKQPAFPLIVYILYGQVVYFLQRFIFAVFSTA
jgi:hypothetical protein